VTAFVATRTGVWDETAKVTSCDLASFVATPAGVQDETRASSSRGTCTLSQPLRAGKA